MEIQCPQCPALFPQTTMRTRLQVPWCLQGPQAHVNLTALVRFHGLGLPASKCVGGFYLTYFLETESQAPAQPRPLQIPESRIVIHLNTKCEKHCPGLPLLALEEGWCGVDLACAAARLPLPRPLLASHVVLDNASLCLSFSSVHQGVSTASPHWAARVK